MTNDSIEGLSASKVPVKSSLTTQWSFEFPRTFWKERNSMQDAKTEAPRIGKISHEVTGKRAKASGGDREISQQRLMSDKRRY